MKTSILSGTLLGAALLLAAREGAAHGLWIESGQGGYKIFFGEPEHDLREKREKLERFTALKTWKSDGTEARLELREDHLGAASAPGGFTAANLDSPVREPKEGMAATEGGPVKSYQYLRFVDGLEAAGKAYAPLFLDIVPEGKPVPGPNVEADGKGSLKFAVLKDGKVEILAPWAGLYILKASWKDRTPGEFKGKKYAVANHSATLSFVKP